MNTDKHTIGGYYGCDMKRHPASSIIGQQEFESSVAAMAQDPEVQAECAAIARDFAATERDGLRVNKQEWPRMNADERG
jgi:hypothetical protein